MPVAMPVVHLPTLLSLVFSAEQGLQSSQDVRCKDVAIFLVVVTCMTQLLCMLRLNKLAWLLILPYILWHMGVPIRMILEHLA